jgi:hypothetical protein
MNPVLKSSISSMLDHSWESGYAGTILRATVRITYGHDSDSNEVHYFKFKSCVYAEYTLERKIFDAYRALRMFLLGYLTPGQYAKEGSHRVPLNFIKCLYKEALARGLDDWTDGEYKGTFLMELDFTHEPGDMLAVVFRSTGGDL